MIDFRTNTYTQLREPAEKVWAEEEYSLDPFWSRKKEDILKLQEIGRIKRV